MARTCFICRNDGQYRCDGESCGICGSLCPAEAEEFGRGIPGMAGEDYE